MNVFVSRSFILIKDLALLVKKIKNNSAHIILTTQISIKIVLLRVECQIITLRSLRSVGWGLAKTLINLLVPKYKTLSNTKFKTKPQT